MNTFGWRVFSACSAAVDSSSNSFSPGGSGERDVDIDSGRKPESVTRSRARSTIFTGSPMSRMKISPPAHRARLHHELARLGIVMKYRRISGCVTRTGPPFAICWRKIGITLPAEPSTLPNRTVTNRVCELPEKACR